MFRLFDNVDNFRQQFDDLQEELVKLLRKLKVGVMNSKW